VRVSSLPPEWPIRAAIAVVSAATRWEWRAVHGDFASTTSAKACASCVRCASVASARAGSGA
jgi:hypothetical protein